MKLTLTQSIPFLPDQRRLGLNRGWGRVLFKASRMQSFVARHNRENHSWRIGNVESLYVMGAEIAYGCSQSKSNDCHNWILDTLPSLTVGCFWTSCSLPGSGSSDFHFFPNLHRFFDGEQFSTREEVMAVVHNYLSNLGVSFYTTGITKLLKHYEKCLNSFGNYIKK